MSPIGTLIAFLALAGLIIGATSVFQPMKRLGIKTKKQGALILIGGIVLLGLGPIVDPTPADPAPAKMSAVEASKTLSQKTPSKSARPGAVSAESIGAQWPFTVTSGYLKCVPDGPRKYVTFVDDNTGTEYAVNGSARGAGKWVDSNTIRRRHAPEHVKVVSRLTEKQRRSAFAQLVACEDGDSSDRCKQAVRKSIGITSTEEDDIGNEGLENGWPPLSPRTAGDPSRLISIGLSLCQP